MAEVRLRRLWFVAGQRFRKSEPGSSTTIPDHILAEYELPPDAEVLEWDDIPNVDPDELESPVSAAARALKEQLDREAAEQGQASGEGTAEVIAAAAADAEEKRRIALENAQKRAQAQKEASKKSAPKQSAPKKK